MTDEHGAPWQEQSSSSPPTSSELNQQCCSLHIHLTAGLQTAAAGPGLETGHLCSCCPREITGCSPCSLGHALAGSSPGGFGAVGPKAHSVSCSRASPLGVHGFDRGETEQPADSSPTRGGGNGSKELGRLPPPLLALGALNVCRGLSGHMDPAHPAAAPSALILTSSCTPAPV